MPQITDQKQLKSTYRLILVSKGPINNMWRGQYLKCPICQYYVCKGAGYDECECGNISMDSDMLRVAIQKSKASDIEVYNAKKIEES